jgi:hypothetical protein
VLSQPPRSRILQDTILGAAVNCLLHRTECASKGQCSVMTACPGQVPTTHQAVSSIGSRIERAELLLSSWTVFK